MEGDDHKITAQIDGVTAVVDIYSRTSDIAAWSVAALLKNLVSPIMF
jgi:aspartate dehydrogenase